MDKNSDLYLWHIPTPTCTKYPPPPVLSTKDPTGMCHPCWWHIPHPQYSVQKTLRGCATNMGSKISLLVYERLLMKCKIWYINGLIFQNLSQKWLKLIKFWKNWVILLKIGPIGIYKWVTFSWKIGTCMGLLSNSVKTHPCQNQTWVPSGTPIQSFPEAL